MTDSTLLGVWRPIPGYEGQYEASDEGQIKSLSDRFGRERILRPATVGKPGYQRVVLTDLTGIRRQWSVHILVLLAFVGPCPEGLETLHRDGDAGNNRLTNIHYGTRSENAKDRVRHGTHNMSRKTHCARGHLLIEGNLYTKRGKRECVACRRRVSRNQRG